MSYAVNCLNRALHLLTQPSKESTIMGHSTHISEISQEELDSHNAWQEKERKIALHSWPGEKSTKANTLLSMAINDWRDDPDMDRGNASWASAEMVTPLPKEVALGVNCSHEVSSRKSIVIPVIDEKDYEIKESRVTIKLDGKEWADYLGSETNVLLNKVLATKPELNGMITSIQTVDASGDKTISARGLKHWKVVSTVKADTSGGKTKNVYYLSPAVYPIANQTYPTQALARAAAVEILNSRSDILTIEVKAKVEREDSSSLVTVLRDVKSATAKVVVSYAKVTTKTPARIKSYLVGFDYHS